MRRPVRRQPAATLDPPWPALVDLIHEKFPKDRWPEIGRAVEVAVAHDDFSLLAQLHVQLPTTNTQED